MALYDVNLVQQWRYCIAECTVLLPGETISLRAENIVGMEITNNYWSDVFPIFRLNLILDRKEYYKISQYKSSLKIHLRVQKYYTKVNTTYTSMRRDYINDTFVLVDDEKDVDRTRDQDLLNKRLDVDIDNGLPKFDQSMELYLYKEASVTGVKKQAPVNLCQDCNLTDVIGYVLGTAGVRNCIMSPLENTKRYEVIYLPPLSINRLLAHLDACYGFYRYGSIIFFGIDRTYILNFKGGGTAFQNGENPETRFMIPKENSAEFEHTGSIEIGGNVDYIHWNYGKVGFGNKTMTGNVLGGSDALVINNSAKSTTSSTGNTDNYGTHTTAVIDNRGDNQWLDTTFTAQTSCNTTVLTGAIADFDASVLTPNKKYSVIFEDQAMASKYKGSYMLSYCALSFQNDTGKGDFKLMASIELHRMEQTASSTRGSI